MKCVINLVGFQKFDEGTEPTLFGNPKFVILAYVMYNIFVLLQRLTEESMITRCSVQKVTRNFNTV
jgi:hypothetical protein